MHEPTPREREYLEVIYYLRARDEPVIAARIADWLQVAAPTVTAMLKRLVAKDYIQRVEGGPIALTDTGFKVAEATVRRHRLMECFLVDVMGLPWELLHEEAVLLERDLSPAFEERIEALVGTAETCPHGNPVPGNADGYRGTVRLDQTEPGWRFRIERILEEAEEDTALMRHLHSSGVVPGAEFEVGDGQSRYGVLLTRGDDHVSLAGTVAAVIYGERV